MAQADSLLEVRDLSKHFGGVVALDRLSLSIAPNRITGLIGPNGSGKTTAFNLLTGVLKPSGGRITFRGRDITGAPPHRNAALGLARTFQNIRLFKDLPVIDNIAVGLHMRHGSGLWPTLLSWPSAWRSERLIRARAHELLALLGMADRAEVPVGILPYGDQRRVELGRALATEPRLLLLDEPSAGMNAVETMELMRTVRHIQENFDLSVLLVEHDMKMVMGLCEWIYVINQGQLLAAGPPEEIQNHPEVVEAYLGHNQSRAHA
ncbi:MAG TPA: ABC transporter ATP-binding protein [Hyphomicrobiaceae bacterium]